MSNTKVIHHEEYADDFDHVDTSQCTREWYEILHEGKKVLTVERSETYPHKWIAHDLEGRQCFEANQYRNDLFEEIEYEGVFE